ELPTVTSPPSGENDSCFRMSIEGITCQACATQIRDRVESMHGVQSCSVRVDNGTARCRYDPRQISTCDILAQVSHLGFRASSLGEGSAHKAVLTFKITKTAAPMMKHACEAVERIPSVSYIHQD